ncbi:MAG: hypothetical protein V7K46_18805 [Nostoc sp.]
MRNVDAKRLAAGYRKGRIRAASRREGHKERNKKPRKFGAASQRNGITYLY